MTEKIDYFESSRNIKNEIGSFPDIEANLKDMIDEKIEPFDERGNSVNMYRVGKLESGLYVALRAFKSSFLKDQCMESLEIQTDWMENYCQTAEFYHKRKRDVPKFCVGIFYNDNAAILTEDLTENGLYEIEQEEGNPKGIVMDKGVEKREVWIDLDPKSWDMRENMKDKGEFKIRYFLEENVLRLAD